MSALSPAGQHLWNATTGAGAFVYPAVIDAAGNVFIGAGNGSMLAFDGDSGSQMWQRQVGSSPFSSSPVIGGGGDLLIGSTNGAYWSLSSAESSLSGSPSPIYRTPSCTPTASTSGPHASGHGSAGASRASPLVIAGISVGATLLVSCAAIATTYFFRRCRAGAESSDALRACDLDTKLISAEDDDPAMPSPAWRQSSISHHTSAPKPADTAELNKRNVFEVNLDDSSAFSGY